MSLYKVIDEIGKRLFEAENRRIQSWIDKISGANQEAYGSNQIIGFIYAGSFYRPSWLIGMPKEQKPLHASLHAEMDCLVKDRNSIREDAQFVRQALFQVLSPCQNSQDIRDALPECLVPLTSLVCLHRTREPAYTIKTNPRALRQFNDMLPKLELYTASRLIY